MGGRRFATISPAARPNEGREMVSDVTVHRALASPVRSELLALLGGQAAPLTVGRLADILGLHPNTVRSHLAILEHAGLVTSAPDVPNGRGRPGLVYEAVMAAATDTGDAYRLLATLLAELVSADHPDIGSAAEDAAAGWGRRLIASSASGTTASGAAATHRLLDVLATLGFEAALEGGPVDGRLVFRRCPIREVARSHPELACSVHRGLMRGVVDALGGQVTVRDLIAGHDGGPCTSVLRTTA